MGNKMADEMAAARTDKTDESGRQDRAEESSSGSHENICETYSAEGCNAETCEDAET